MKIQAYWCQLKSKCVRIEQMAVFVGMVELTICGLVLCTLLITFTSGLQATLTYGGAAVRLTAVMLMFIGIKEKKPSLFTVHFLVQLFSLVGLLCSMWTTMTGPLAGMTNGPIVPVALYSIGLLLEIIFLLVITRAFCSIRRACMHRSTAQALLCSINDQWRCSVLVSNCELGSTRKSAHESMTSQGTQ